MNDELGVMTQESQRILSDFPLPEGMPEDIIYIQTGISDRTIEQIYSRLNHETINLENIVSNILQVYGSYDEFLEDDVPLEYFDLPEDFLEPVKVQLTKREFENLPMRVMSKKLKKELNIEDKVCPICQDEIKPRCHCTILKCGHMYHKNCAREWLTKQCEKPTCPMCRKDVRETLI